jgi:hypothetical protein
MENFLIAIRRETRFGQLKQLTYLSFAEVISGGLLAGEVLDAKGP